MKTLPVPDERYKLDVLLVVAHPDDEAAATAYLARAMDEGKRAGVAYGTRGSSGANEAGTEQAAALGDIREIEARRALAKLGISDVWFIGGRDTASQDVLQSLSSWDHGAVLEKMVRIVRLTRAGGDSHISCPEPSSARITAIIKRRECWQPKRLTWPAIRWCFPSR